MLQNYVSLLCSINNDPLNYWSSQQSSTGNIRSVLDQYLLQNVVELQDKNSNTYEKTSITCPADSQKMLNIKLPFLVLIMKNIETYCLFKLQVIDKNKNRHYLYFYNDKCEKRRVIKVPNVKIVNINYEREWNKLELNLPKLIWEAFQTNYDAVQRLQIYGNCRLRRVYFIDKHYTEFDISTKLCQNFLEFYMSKWGNCMTERFTQTDKNKCTSPNNTENVPIVYLNISCNKKTNKNHEQLKNNKLKKVEVNFSKLLRSTCRHTIDNFFNINTKSICCFKNPKLDCLSTSVIEKQKILLSTVKFISDIQNTVFRL